MRLFLVQKLRHNYHPGAPRASQRVPLPSTPRHFFHPVSHPHTQGPALAGAPLCGRALALKPYVVMHSGDKRVSSSWLTPASDQGARVLRTTFSPCLNPKRCGLTSGSDS